MSSDNKIRVLPEQVINQIAAGEVIERPAAAVKELLENSLDAGATQVEVEFSGGGKTYIRIEDNGRGMSPDQALLALERHATSKLRRTDDLLTLRTLGFRGEALPSVASISRFTLRTRARDAEHGTELLVDAGKLIHSRQCGLSYGTRIEVAHLFAPVPARRKFLKSDATEGAHITQLVRLHALGRPDVGFHLIENGRTVFRSAPCPTMRDRVAEIWGAQLAAELIELPEMPPLSAQAGLRLRGLVGKVGHGRATRRDMIWLLNGRPIESRLLDNALIDAYEGFLPKGRSPLAFLFLEIDPAAVDINIHPSKKQVRFGAEGQVRHFVLKTVTDLLEQSVHNTLGSAVTRKEATGQSGGHSHFEAETGALPAAESVNPSSEQLGAPAELREGHGLPPVPRRSADSVAPLGGGLPIPRPSLRPQVIPQPPAARQNTTIPQQNAAAQAGAAPVAPAHSVPAAPSSAQSASTSPVHSAPATPVDPTPADTALMRADASVSSASKAGGSTASPPSAGSSLPKPQGSAPLAAERASSAQAASLPLEAPVAGTGAQNVSAKTQKQFPADDADQPQWRFLARLHKEYALMETSNGLVVLRLRAAHERVWFERVCNYLKEEDRSSQQLLLPLSIEFDPLAAAAMQGHLGFFNAHGFEVEAFGRNFYRIHAHPGWLAPERVEPFVRECVEYARRGELKQKGQKAATEGLAKLAATRAIRMGDSPSPAQIEALAAALLRCENPLSCPNGKPTLLEWSLSELGRRFGISR